MIQEMQGEFLLFLLLAAGLLDCCGASKHGHDGSEVLELSFAGGAQPRAESSPEPSQLLSIADDSDAMSFNPQSPAADPTKETGADLGHTAPALQPQQLDTGLAMPQHLHTEAAAALKLQDGHRFPGKLLGTTSVAVSARASLPATRLELPAGALRGQPDNATQAAFSLSNPSTGLPQPSPGARTHQGSAQLEAVPSAPAAKQMEVTNPLTPVVSFHPPRAEAAAPSLPPAAQTALQSAGLGWLPPAAPGTRSPATKPPAQAASRAAVTPACPKETQSVDAQVAASAFLQSPASGDLDAAYHRVTQPSAVQVSPGSSLKQGTAGREARSSAAAVTKAPAHPSQLPAAQTPLQGSVHAAAVLQLGAQAEGELLPSPVPGSISTIESQQPLSGSQPANCAQQQVAPEPSSSSEEAVAPGLQSDAAQQLMASKADNSRAHESPQGSAHSSSPIATAKPSQATEEPRAATPAAASESAALQPGSSPGAPGAGLQPPAAARLPLLGTLTPAETGARVPTSPTPAAPGSHVRAVSAPPVSQEAFPGLLQVSTVAGSRSSSTQQLAKAAPPPGAADASPAPSPSALHRSSTQKLPLPSSASSALQEQQAGSLAQLPSLQSSSAAAPPGPVVPKAPEEMPALLAQAAAQQLGMAQDAATTALSALGGEQLTVLPSPPRLSFLLRSANGMICLQPTQGSPLPTQLPTASLGGLVSVQQILAASNSSALDLGSLHNLSHSSLILVKPVFVLLPTDRADPQVVPSPEGQGAHQTALLVTSRKDLSVATPESSHSPVTTTSSYPTSRSLRPETLSSGSKQGAEQSKGTSLPALPSPSPTAVFPAEALLQPWLGLSTAMQAMPLHRLPADMQLPAPSSPHPIGTALALQSRLLAEPSPHPVLPAAVSAQNSSQSAPRVLPSTKRPQMTPAVPSAKGLGGLQTPSQPPSTAAVPSAKALLGLQTPSQPPSTPAVPSAKALLGLQTPSQLPSTPAVLSAKECR
ncbi:proline-rich protein 36-like [Pogoniulus pusillus]|uniref:proline-rich protein 36-like n=1 Tax=Pogoniulus pusillus TaxID=488313 RepID=UPI0030B979D7